MRTLLDFSSKPRSIAGKLNRIYLLVVLLVLFSAGLIAQIHLYRHALAVTHDNLRTQAAALAGNLESAVVFGDERFARQTLNALRHYPEVRMAVVMLDGKELAHYGARSDEFLRHFKDKDEFVGFHEHGVAQAVARNGGARLFIVSSLQDLNRQTLESICLGLVIGTLILLASLIIFRGLTRTVTHPIEDLGAVIRTIEREGDHGQRARIVSDDEIGQLAQSFNAMLTALEAATMTLNGELNERKRMQEKLDRLAHYDPLTHLPNRHYFGERLKISMARSRQLDEPMAVMFVDLDNFKRVNDSFGHHLGDLLLLAVADRLSSALRGSDVVCRLGGDEFSVILEYLPETLQLAQITDKMIFNLTQPLRLENIDIVVTASVGIAVYPDDATNAETLLRFADVAMYAAKNDGKNTWRRFDPEMATQISQRLTLENQMRQGLQGGQFEVHYQPQIDTANGEVSGFEALVRWKHPVDGYIGPADFIPVAEESGLIRPLGEWVLRTACRQIVAWNQQSAKCRTIAVNVSPRQLVHADFAAVVLGILHETGCPPHFLELEITESILMQHIDHTLALLKTLRQHEIGIAIDDFGTGYSSMAQLKNLPVTKLKIDKSFVDEIASSHNDLAITAAMVNLAHKLEIKVIAEGIENHRQVQLLQQYGCHSFQGYYFAKPLLAQRIPDFLAAIRFGDAEAETGAGSRALVPVAYALLSGQPLGPYAAGS